MPSRGARDKEKKLSEMTGILPRKSTAMKVSSGAGRTIPTAVATEKNDSFKTMLRI